MSRSIWSVLCTDPDKCTVVINYIILQPDASCEVLLAADKSSRCYFDFAPVKAKAFFLPFRHERITDNSRNSVLHWTSVHPYIPNSIFTIPNSGIAPVSFWESPKKGFQLQGHSRDAAGLQ